MKKQPSKSKWLPGLAVFLLTSAVSQADSFTHTYSGSLASTSTVVQEDFSLSSASQLLATTTSYATGGFQPSLTLYTGAGVYIASQQAGSPVATPDPVTGLALDVYLSAHSLQAGSYILTLTNWQTQQPPTATNLSDGFVNYGGSTFMDVSGATRTANYVLNINAMSAASAVQEPAASAITGLGLGIALLAALRKRSRKEL